MRGRDHYEPLIKWCGVVVIGVPLVWMVLASRLQAAGGKAAVREHFGLLFGLGRALIGLAALFMLLTVIRRSRINPSKQVPEDPPPPEELRALLVELTERIARERVEKPPAPLPAGIDPHSDIGRRIIRMSLLHRELEPDQSAALVLTARYGMQGRVPGLPSILAPAAFIALAFTLGSLLLVVMPWAIVRAFEALWLPLLLIASGMLTVSDHSRTRALAARISSADLAVAQVMDGPYRLVDAFRYLEPDDPVEQLAPRGTPFSYHWRRRCLEAALESRGKQSADL